MESREDRLARLRKASKESAEAADALLADELTALRNATQGDLAALSPKVQDKESFEKLRAAVEASTRANEDRAELQQRITSLGNAVVQTAKEVAGLLKV